MRLLNKFYFKVKGDSEIYRAILVDEDMWAVDKMGKYFGRGYIEYELHNGNWELIDL